ncbi:DUF3231 family protein [Sporosarcina sp. HYO08]|uniref:DUF3231 family protein n=1 Tax=Sporosarcina sp. HYO08 TaxID=1759557 RepID=UPI0007928E53|nr:DUF3231 family protein [Sporosarcina sp. HYO08]KXH83844.1 hypothetical protein AU377_03535 [Sporosarcina sp. HYO08]
MGVMSGNPKNEPMHYGEVIGVWAFIAANNGLISGYEAFINHVGDGDLGKLVKEAIDLMKSEKKELEGLLKDNGIALPPAAPDRPKANAEEIPVGARFTDLEIATAVGSDVGKGLVSCSAVIGQCLREDIGMMFGKYHMERAKFGLKALRLAKEKGWVVPPPLHSSSVNNE